MRFGRAVRAAAVASGWLLSAMTTHAECVSPGFNPTGRLCSGCRYEGHMSMAQDQTCERPYRPNSANSAAILSNKLVRPAKHGIAGTNNNTFAYKPGQGYVGKDDFVVEVTFRDLQDNKVGKFQVHWNIDVH